MAKRCPHCGTALPLVHDAFCPDRRESLSAVPARPAAEHERQGALGSGAAPSPEPAVAGHLTAAWSLGLLAGTAFGLALAMIIVEPEWITPPSAARRYVAIGGLVAASAVTWFYGRLKKKVAHSMGRAR